MVPTTASIDDGSGRSAGGRREPHLRLVEGEGVDPAGPWTLLVVDDDEEIHRLIRLIAEEIRFQGRPVEVVSAYSAAEATRRLDEFDVALVLLDVVMETDQAGLDLVEDIRARERHRATRIVIVTGQPGLAPEHEVVNDFDINGYVNKSLLDSVHLTSTIVTSLRMYADYGTIEALARTQQRMAAAFDEQNRELERVNGVLREQIVRNEALRAELGSADDRVDTIVDQRTAELELELERAQLANEAKTEFVASMAHELRSPLQTIIGYAELLEAEDDEDRSAMQVSGLSAIGRAGEHMDEIISDVLDLARIESGTRRIEVGSLSIGDITSEVMALVRPTALARGIRCVDSVPADLPAALGARRSIKQVLLNLVGNGIKYNRPNGRVEVSAEVVGDEIEISVEDDGIGIPAALHERVFRPFERLTVGGDSAVGGSGIGLTISQRLLQELQSELWFTSTEGLGSRFYFALPVDPGAA